jgi:hypothetical protein
MFVDRCFDEIVEKLGDENMTREEALDAICFGDYEEHFRNVRRLIREGKVPAFQKGKLATV